jgi:hypothetical protein
MEYSFAAMSLSPVLSEIFLVNFLRKKSEMVSTPPGYIQSCIFIFNSKIQNFLNSFNPFDISSLKALNIKMQCRYFVARDCYMSTNRLRMSGAAILVVCDLESWDSKLVATE